MSLLLPNHSWRIRYNSNENNPIADFYIPALECAIQYDRKAGFFNSAILSKVARGLGAMLENQGQMRLIMGCQFSPQDLTAIQQGYELRDILLQRLQDNFTPPTHLLQLKHFEILSWLIANYFLEIKIAIPLKNNHLSDELDTHHLFHEKSGIFTDQEGNQIAFNGSNNESLSGWEQNVESFDVYAPGKEKKTWNESTKNNINLINSGMICRLMSRFLIFLKPLNSNYSNILPLVNPPGQSKSKIILNLFLYQKIL
jgi:hypothetical protein